MSFTTEEVKATFTGKLSAVKAQAKAWIMAKSDQRPWVIVGYSAAAGLILGFAVNRFVF